MCSIYYQHVFNIYSELPWDEPSYACQEYCDWKEGKITLNPWKKIDNLALCKICMEGVCVYLMNTCFI